MDKTNLCLPFNICSTFQQFKALGNIVSTQIQSVFNPALSVRYQSFLEECHMYSSLLPFTWHNLLLSNEFYFSLGADRAGRGIHARRVQGQRCSSVFDLLRSTTITPDMMLGSSVYYNSMLPLVILCTTLKAQPPNDDMPLPFALHFMTLLGIFQQDNARLCTARISLICCNTVAYFSLSILTRFFAKC